MSTSTLKQAAPVRVAIYARISEDTAGDSKGVDRQIEDARELAASRGWEIAAIYTDNDLSAYKSRVRRPGYQNLIAAVEDGEIDRIIAYHSSRLWRNRVERAQAMEIFESKRITVTQVRGPEIDYSTATGRTIAGIMGEVDTGESAVKSERIARAAEQRAAEGRPSGDLGYGWDLLRELRDGKAVTVGYAINEAEAAVVREIVTRVIAGETLRAITMDLNDRGIPSPGAAHKPRGGLENPTGQRWGTSSVRKIATRPSSAGLRVHHGEVIGKGTWPELITEDEHRQAVEAVSDPARMTNGGNAVRKHLLTFGIGICGVCGWHLRTAPKSGNTLYLCDSDRGCVGRRKEWVDDLVNDVVIKRLQQPDAVDLLDAPIVEVTTDNGPMLAKLDATRKKLDEAADAYSRDKITLSQMTIISDRLRNEIDAIERELRPNRQARPSSKTARKIVGKRNARALWLDLSVLEQREVLQALGMTVTIMPTPKGPGFKPEYIHIAWGQES